MIAELEPGFEDYGTAYRGDGGNEPATEPAANYYVAFENGVRAYVTGMKDTVAADVLLHLIGPEGRLTIDLEGMRIMSVANEDVRTKAGVATIQPVTPHWTVAGFQAAWLDLIDALETGREVESPAESARRTVALTQAILLSQQRGNVRVHLAELAAPAASRHHRSPPDRKEDQPCVSPPIAAPTDPVPGPSSARPAPSVSSTSTMRPADGSRRATSWRCSRRTRSTPPAQPAATAWRSSVELLAPMRRPPKVLAAAGNYQAHIVEGGQKPVDKTVIVPKLFMKPSSAVLDPGKAITLPSTSNTNDWELELGVVIGRRGKDIPVGEALSYVAGYTVINDVSARTSSGASTAATRRSGTSSSTGSTASGRTASPRPGPGW